MSTSDEHQVRVPSTVTIKDMIYFGTILVAITTSFLLYGTRLSVMEQQMLTFGNNITEIKQDIKQLIQDEEEDVDELQTDIKELQIRQNKLESDHSIFQWYIDQDNISDEGE